MKFQTVTGNYKTITYRFIKRGKVLIIILPRAGAEFSSHKKLAKDLSKIGSVLFIETGYFGITKLNESLKEIKMDRFRTVLHELIDSLGFAKTILIGESVGGIHALNYSSRYPHEIILVILSNPALYQPKWIYERFFVPMLRLGIKTSPDIFLISLGKLLTFSPEVRFKKLGETFIRIHRRVGAKSFLYCLKEIVDFKSKYYSEEITKVLPKTYVIKGEKDKVFDLLCNGKYCKTCSSYIEVYSAGHGIIDSNPEQVIKLVQQRDRVHNSLYFSSK